MCSPMRLIGSSRSIFRLSTVIPIAASASGRGLATPSETDYSFSPGALVLAVALPLLFLHRAYQPSFDISFAGTTATAYLSDFAVLAVLLAAAAAALQEGVAPLRRGLPLWIAGVAFLLWVAAEVVLGAVRSGSYASATHAVTAVKFGEYLLLAPAVVLIVRRTADVVAVCWSLTLWCAVATTVALARPRLGLGRSFAAAALTVGGLGAVLAGSLAAVLGFLTGVVVLFVALGLQRAVTWRAVAAVGVAAGAVVLGAAAIRGNDLQAFARFTGVSTDTVHGRAVNVQTYSQRSLLSWIGFEIWRNHPLLGVGWQGSTEPANFGPVLPAARRHFPDVAAKAFPAALPGRQYGVQNSWVQALADLGILGFVLWLAMFLAAGWLAVRKIELATALGLTITAALFWLWSAQGFYAGIPLDALTALAFGLAATEVARP
jgi:O-antigen ligase